MKRRSILRIRPGFIFCAFSAFLALATLSGRWTAAVECPGGPLAAALRVLDSNHREFEPHLGTPVKARPEWSLAPDSEVRLLSDGVPGKSEEGNYGQSYLVISKTAEPYVLKVYEEHAAMENDLNALGFLKSCVHASKAAHEFRVVQATKVGKVTLRLGYQRGRDLTNLLGDPHVSDSVKHRLVALYKERVQNLMLEAKRIDSGLEIFASEWRSNPELGDLGHVTIRSHKSPKKRLVDGINLNPRQIIVDPVSLEMTIIDPI
jgi:hypothetical protein